MSKRNSPSDQKPTAIHELVKLGGAFDIRSTPKGPPHGSVRKRAKAAKRAAEKRTSERR